MAKQRLLRFVANVAWDVLPDLFLPGAAQLLLKGCQHFYCHFLATDPAGETGELLDEARALTDQETEAVIDALAAGWQDRLPGGKLDDRQRARLRELVRSLATAGKVPEAQQAEELRSSLNRSLAAAGQGQIPENPLSPGQLLLGRSVMALSDDKRRPLTAAAPTVPGYRLTALLGTGGFGAVYLARHEASGEWRAVKVGKIDVRRFEAEVRTLQQLSHSAESRLVRYHEHGEIGNGMSWIAMEYLGQHTLADLLSQQASRPDVEQALHIAEEVLRGLAELHAHKVLHRDLKPENVMVDAFFRVRLIDFGLVKPMTSLLHTTQATVGFVGTPLYASPEQVDEDPLTLASDVWSFGCVVYQLLTGQPPFQPKNPLQVSKTIHTTRVVFDRPDVPPELREILRRCLLLNPGERWADAQSCLTAFLPLRQECSRRLRHERFQGSWVPILERGLLQKYAEKCQGRAPGDMVGGFVVFARGEGCGALDEERLAEVLPLVFEAWASVEAAKRDVEVAKTALAESARRLTAAELMRQSQLIGEREQEASQREQEVSRTVQRLLAGETRSWEEETRQKQQREEEKATQEKAQRERQEEAKRLREQLLGDMANVALRKRYLLVRTPEQQAADRRLPLGVISPQILIMSLIPAVVGVVLGAGLGWCFSAIGAGALWGAGLLPLFSLLLYIIVLLPAESQIRAEVGPLPWDAGTNKAEVRKKFLGE